MNRPVIVGVLTLAAGAAVFLYLQSRGPRYAGKSLDQWATALTSTNQAEQSNAIVALRAMGTNALPGLIDRLAADESPVQSNAAWLLHRYTGLRILDSGALQANREAHRGFAALGPSAKAAIPELVEMLENPRTANRASYLLCSMDDDVIPALLIAITNADVEVRRRTTVDLGARHTNAPGVIDALLARLAGDSDSSVRSMAAGALGRIPELPEAAMKPLIKALYDSDERWVVSFAAQTLGDSFGPRAIAAVPRLIELWQRHGRWTAAAGALTKIDAETARKHGAFVEFPPNPYE